MSVFTFKTPLPLALLASLSHTPLVTSQQILKTINLYANQTVDPFSTQSTQLELLPDGAQGSNSSACMANTVGLGSAWPMTSNGRSMVWIDALGPVRDGCQLRFYDPPQSDDAWAGDPDKYCQGLTYVVTGKVAMAYVELGSEFGTLYCCDDACDQKESLSKRDLALHEPLGSYERARALGAVPHYGSPLEARGSKCAFSGTGDPITTYGYPDVVGAKMACGTDEDSTACMQTKSFSTSSTVSTYRADSMSMGVSISGDIFSSFLSFLGIDLSMSYEESESAENTTSWSVDYTLGPTPGTTGYPSFQPKLKCARGNFVGSCDGTDGLKDSEWKCTNSYVQNGGSNIEPEGIWRMVTET